MTATSRVPIFRWLIANERSTAKQTADPTGSSTYGGILYSFAAMLRYLY